MKYGYLLDDSFLEAPKYFIKVGDVSIFNPKEEHYKAAGYLPLIESKKPDDEKQYRDVYSINEDETKIIQSWEEIPTINYNEINYNENDFIVS
jgi:hypothetical protein